MNEEPIITTDFILATMKEYIEDKKPVAPSVWIDAAMKLNILVADDADKLFGLKQEAAQLRVMYLENGDSVAKAKVKLEATDLFRSILTLEAKIGRIEETVRLAKARAKMSDTEFKGY